MPEFIDGVETFIRHASGLIEYVTYGKIRCPCMKCYKRGSLLLSDDVREFRPNYWHWTDHGDKEQNSNNCQHIITFVSSGHVPLEDDDPRHTYRHR